MSKSNLTTSEIKDLFKNGMSLNAIAQQARISVFGIKWRLMSDFHRINNKEHSKNISEDAKKIKLQKQNHWYKDMYKQTIQNIMLKNKKSRRFWSEQELNYLKKYGNIKTAFQLAIDLRRSLNSVFKAAYRYDIPLRYK